MHFPTLFPLARLLFISTPTSLHSIPQALDPSVPVAGTQTQRGMDLCPPDLFCSILGVAGGGNHRFFFARRVVEVSEIKMVEKT